MNKKFNDFLDYSVDFALKKDKKWRDEHHLKYYFAFVLVSIYIGASYIIKGDIVAKVIGLCLCIYSISCYIHCKKNKNSFNLKTDFIVSLNVFLTIYILFFMGMVIACIQFFDIGKINGLLTILFFITVNVICVIITLFVIRLIDFDKLRNKVKKPGNSALITIFAGIGAVSGISLSRISGNFDNSTQGYISLIMLLCSSLVFVPIIFTIASLLIFRNLNYDFDKREYV